VTAARDWGGPAERRHLRPALTGSWEHLFHSLGVPAFLLLPSREPEVATALRDMRLERAIGVIYRPEMERASHYFGAALARQFDAVVHIDQSRAVVPLERAAAWEHGELPETFPSAV
jgi:erythromycin esterase-like protein